MDNINWTAILGTPPAATGAPVEAQPNDIIFAAYLEDASDEALWISVQALTVEIAQVDERILDAFSDGAEMDRERSAYMAYNDDPDDEADYLEEIDRLERLMRDLNVEQSSNAYLMGRTMQELASRFLIPIRFTS